MQLKLAALWVTLGLTASCTAQVSGRYPAIDSTVLGQKTSAALEARLLDEVSDLAPTTFASQDGVLKGTVLAKGTVTASKAVRGYVVNVELGSAEPLQCTVQKGVLGLSAFARALARAYLASYETHELKYAFAGTNGGLPYLAVHGQYIDRGPSQNQRRTGFVKLAIAGQAELTVACFHDQFGYRETVERVALSLISKLRWTGPKPLRPLVRRWVYAVSKDNQAVGIREVVIRADEEDFRRSWIRTSFLSVGGPQDLNARDILETYDSDPDGRVYAQTYEARENGKMQSEWTLEERPMNDYEVSGSLNQQAAKVRFAAPEGIPDLLLCADYLRAKKPFARFMPQVSTGQLTPVEIQKSASQVRISSGAQVMTGQLDAAGHWVRGMRSDGYAFVRTASEP